jgi:hypothetical protein
MDDNADQNQAQANQARDAEAKPIASTGALKLSVPSPLGPKNDEEYWLQTVDIAGPKPPEIKEGSYVKMPAKEFSKLVHQVGISVGKKTQSVDNSNVLVRQSPSSPNLDVVTFNGYTLGWARSKNIEAQPLVGLVQYEDCLTVAKLVDPERELSIFKPSNSPDGIIVSQELVLGTTSVGRVQHRIYAVSDKFAKFEKTIKALSFDYGFKANKQQFQYAMGRLGIMDKVRTTLVIDPQAKVVMFAKADSELRIRGIALPIDNIRGSERFELDVSSKHLHAGLAQCDSEEVDISFSGRHALARMTISDSFEMFFQPFGEEK